MKSADFKLFKIDFAILDTYEKRPLVAYQTVTDPDSTNAEVAISNYYIYDNDFGFIEKKKKKSKQIMTEGIDYQVLEDE